MVKNSMNPALIAVVVILVVLISVVLYLNGKENYRNFPGLISPPFTSPNDFDRQCKRRDGRYFNNNSFRCLPYSRQGKTLFMRARNHAARTNGHIYHLYDVNNKCSGGVLVCSSVGGFIDRGLANMQRQRQRQKQQEAQMQMQMRRHEQMKQVANSQMKGLINQNKY